MHRDDALAPVQHRSNEGAEIDYGPGGPQYRAEQQLGQMV